jgi:hypothetical protein
MINTVTALLLRCCYTVVTLLFHCCSTVVTLLLHCCYTVVTLLLHCCYTTGGSERPLVRCAEEAMFRLSGGQWSWEEHHTEDAHGR